MENLIRVENLTKEFKESTDLHVKALSNVSLEIAAGAFTALSGPSGSGKTTLLNLIGCLDKPSSGKIFLDGNEVSAMPQNRLSEIRLSKIGFIFQDYNLIPTFSAVENIEYVLWLQGKSGPERRKKAEEIGKRFGIGHLLTRRPSQMSRGQQQRVAVARAIVHNPKIVLGDELTANLDHKTGCELLEFLKGLNEREGITFIYATHDPVMIQYANAVIKMQDGQLVKYSSVS
jgi:putative ABC transport system ATP-binding protein